MASKEESVQVIYSYDPLDRHTHTKKTDGTRVQIFYCGDRVATELTGDTVRTVFEAESAVLAQQTTNEGGQETTLIAHDDKRSTLLSLRANEAEPEATAYTAFGHSPVDKLSHRVLGFNGERLDKNSGFYLLGNGYRAFNTVLMRFNSPDNLSPFGDGGINAYAYCAGDPVNRTDPSGHSWLSLFKGIGNLFGRQRGTFLDLGPLFKMKVSKTNFKVYGWSSVDDSFKRVGTFPRNKYTKEFVVDTVKDVEAQMLNKTNAAKQAAGKQAFNDRVVNEVNKKMIDDPRFQALQSNRRKVNWDAGLARERFKKQGGRFDPDNGYTSAEEAALVRQQNREIELGNIRGELTTQVRNRLRQS